MITPPPEQHKGQHQPMGLPWLGYPEPRQWQAEALPLAMKAIDNNVRGIIRACTGAGKAACLVELAAQYVEDLEPDERIVISAPTQQLIDQLYADMSKRAPGRVSKYYQYNKSVQAPIIIVCHASMHQPDIFCPQCHRSKVDRLTRHMTGQPLKDARVVLLAQQMLGELDKCEDMNHTQLASNPHRLVRQLVAQDLKVKLWIADEAHKTQSPSPMGFAEWMQPEQRIGFTATPWRSGNERLELFDELLYDYGPVQAIRDGVVLEPTIKNYTGELTDQDEVCLEMIREHVQSHGGPGVVSAYSIEDATTYAQVLTGHGIRAEAIHSKQTADRQERLLGMLERGELDCLVHVALLAEGVDLKWLSWLCMRRAVGSKVRFAQEVGRVLRTMPGKIMAYVLDPHDLFGKLSLDYVAVLGGECEDETSEERELERELKLLMAEEQGPNEGGADRSIKRAKAMDVARSWLRIVSFKMRIRGHLALKVSSTDWRGLEPTKGQLSRIEHTIRHANVREAAGAMDEEQRTMMGHLHTLLNAELLTRGDASDYIDILDVLMREKRWPELTPPAPHMEWLNQCKVTRYVGGQDQVRELCKDATVKHVAEQMDEGRRIMLRQAIKDEGRSPQHTYRLLGVLRALKHGMDWRQLPSGEVE